MTRRKDAPGAGSQDGQAVVGPPRGDGLQAALPASWGSSPEVLPGLEELSLVMQVVPPLPAAWAAGLRRLRQLDIMAPVEAPVPASATNVLPPGWAAGFPALRSLGLARLGLTGGIPLAWADGFPELTSL